MTVDNAPPCLLGELYTLCMVRLVGYTILHIESRRLSDAWLVNGVLCKFTVNHQYVDAYFNHIRPLHRVWFMRAFIRPKVLVTGQPTHSAEGRLVTVAGVCRRPSSSVVVVVVVCNIRICNVTHQGLARGGPVVLRPVSATPCANIGLCSSLA